MYESKKKINSNKKNIKKIEPFPVHFLKDVNKLFKKISEDFEIISDYNH